MGVGMGGAGRAGCQVRGWGGVSEMRASHGAHGHSHEKGSLAWQEASYKEALVGRGRNMHVFHGQPSHSLILSPAPPIFQASSLEPPSC